MKHRKILATIFFTFTIAFSIGFSIQVASAQSELRNSIAQQSAAFGGKEGVNLGAPRDPRLIAGEIISTLLGLLGLLTVAYMIYGGATIMLSGGSEEKIDRGKEILKNTVIGLFLILSAYSITRFAVRIASGDKARQGTNCQINTSNNDAQKDPLGGYNSGETIYQDCITN